MEKLIEIAQEQIEILKDIQSDMDEKETLKVSRQMRDWFITIIDLKQVKAQEDNAKKVEQMVDNLMKIDIPKVDIKEIDIEKVIKNIQSSLKNNNLMK